MRRLILLVTLVLVLSLTGAGEDPLALALERESWIFGEQRPVFSGTFMDFQHHNQAEAPYWNPQARLFTDACWEAKVEEMADLGMEYIVVMAVALYGQSFYPSQIYPRFPLKAEDPVDAVLRAAQRRGVKVFLGAGFYGDWTRPWEAFTDRGIRERTRVAIFELAEKYGHYESFYGYYWPNEVGIDGYFSQGFINHVKENNAWAKQAMPQAKTMIAPYGTNRVRADARYVAQLNELGVDIIAYQDEVGVRKTHFEELAGIYRQLRWAHDQTQVALWADLEIFEFEGNVYTSPLIPADINRIRFQLKNISPYVDEIIIYQYLGLMDKPQSLAPAGPPSAQTLYTQYERYIQGLPTIHY